MTANRQPDTLAADTSTAQRIAEFAHNARGHFATSSDTSNMPQSAETEGVADMGADEPIVYTPLASTPHSPLPHALPASLPSASTSSTADHVLKQTIADKIAKTRRGRHFQRIAPTRRNFRHLDAHEKFGEVYRFLGVSDSMAFTLHFDHLKLARMTAVEDPARELSGRINRLVKQLIGVPLAYTFTLECSPAGLLHVHGAFVVPGGDKAMLPVMRQVLKRAAGVMHGAAQEFQLQVKPLRDRDWQQYVVKDGEITRHTLGVEKLTHVSRELLAGARSYYDQKHAAMKQDARSRRPLR